MKNYFKLVKTINVGKIGYNKMKKIKFSTVREKIQFYLIDSKTMLGKLIDIFIIFLNIIISALFVIETYNISDEVNDILWNVEIVIIFLFTIEYLFRLYGARNRITYFFNFFAIIDLLTILPTLLIFIFPSISLSLKALKIIRLIKVFRIFKFLRFLTDGDFFFGNVSIHYLKVIRLVFTIFLIFFISSGLFWTVEHGINPKVISFTDAFYFTVVSLTTVGFGDITPISEAGRWVTILMILSGVILIPWQASQIIREWLIISLKKDVTCSKCGLQHHDRDASHCKSCGNIIYLENG